MPGKERWFEETEYRSRVAAVRERLRERGLDGLLAFQAESVTWLTGFFTRAYGGFQFALLPPDRDPIVVCRDQSAFYVRLRGAFDRYVVWRDGEDPTAAGVRAIAETFGRSTRLGIEMGAWHLTAARFEALRAALPGTGFEDVGDLVARQRLVKSAAELEYQRRAGRAAEAGMAAGVEAARAGLPEREVAAAVCAALVRAGSDEPGPGVLASGPRARHLHGGYGDRILEEGDTLQLEVTPNVRQYHARFMRTIKIGRATAEERSRAAALIAIQDRALAEVGPGVPAALPDRIYREGIAATGLTDTYTNKTFYSVGLLLRPSGGEPLEATPGCTWRFRPGMTFHTYVLVDGFGFSETIAVTATGHERLTRYPRRLIVTRDRPRSRGPFAAR